MRFFWFILGLIALSACQRYSTLPGTATDNDWKVKPLPASPQQMDGDPEAGYAFIGGGSYIGSGVPFEMMKKRLSGTTDTVLRRGGVNANLPYPVSAFEAAKGGTLVMNGNCFTCHAGEVNGQIVPGLGNSFSDYQKSFKPMGKVIRVGVDFKYKKDEPEWEAYEDFSRYFNAMAPYIQTNQPGANPAFRLAEACMRHRDPVDLTYRETPNYDMMDYTIATDVPPLWHVKKKNALYYNGIGRGDFTKLLFQASVLGIPDSTAAREAIIGFKDVLAWLQTLEPPAYPGPVDQALAAEGQVIFEENCSKCHGTYGEEETYPNKLVSLALVKTDPMYANYAKNSGIVEWYNSSWFAQSEPKSYFAPELGYVAPPLDGIWATAPYLHNGSVPTVAALLDSKNRPDIWVRSGDSRDYDHEQLGWAYTELDKAKGDWAFDTNRPGYSNKGHDFGDKLSVGERTAVIEYLKTL
ncbi:MAG: c-type cytochrome [Phaeodactylibacter sp.]|uniref:c-type cytochrome n=1 Tax=Phaeodactylibacter sp. TaxID=1940289 RepID=UPI0032EBDE2C